MSIKLSFFEIPDFSVDKLEQILLGIDGEKFDQSASSGFIIDRRSNKSIDGRYVQRFQESEVLLDPFGGEYRQEVLYFSEQRFTLADKIPHLTVFDSSTALKALIGRLSEFSDFTIAFKDIHWSTEAVLEAVLLHAPEANVLSAKVSDFRLSTGIQARMVFVGSGQDIRSEVRKFLKNKSVVFSSLKIEYKLAGIRRVCELRNNGVVQNYGDYDPAITAFWLKTIRGIVSPA